MKATIERKGLNVVCNKMLVQMCSKLGGVPWSISEMPFSNEPTMVVGMDVYHQSSKKSILAFLATMDP